MNKTGPLYGRHNECKSIFRAKKFSPNLLYKRYGYRSICFKKQISFEELRILENKE
jgi:hypothetical protein